MTNRKEDARTGNLTQLHERRKRVVELHKAGHPVMQIVQMTGLSWPAVRRAIDSFEAGGEAAIEPAQRGRRAGDGRSLEDAQEAAIRSLICTRLPGALGLGAALWSRPLVHALIERETGLKLSERAVGNYLHRWGFSPPAPPARGEAGIVVPRRWLGDDYPALVRRARAAQAEIHWLHVGPLAWTDTTSTATPDVAGTDTGAGQHLLATITNQRKARWLVAGGDPFITAGTWIRLLGALLDDVDGRLLLLVPQTLASSWRGDIDRWLADRNDRIEVVFRPDGEADPRDSLPATTTTERKTIDWSADNVEGPRSASRTGRSRRIERTAGGTNATVSTEEMSMSPGHQAMQSGRHRAQSIESLGTPTIRAPRGKFMRIRNIAAIGLVAVAAAVGSFIVLNPEKPKKLWAKPIQGDYWAVRVAYPTMHFSPSWYTDAKVEDRQVQSGVPAGEKSYLLRSADSPLALDPENWTALGPQPGTYSGYGMISGRVNRILVDPTGPDANGHHTVLAASDGGGIWKSTNCCSADTTWRNVTDQADIASIAIGDLYIDPNNANVIYAGTGDLRFGSFSFGSSGVLKSVDKGETWTVLGEDVFSPFYPPSAGLGFPQYQAVGKVVTDPNNSNTIIVGTKTGLFVSNDAGSNWTGPCYTNTHSSQRQDITGLFAQNIGGQTSLLAAIGTRGNPTTVQPDLANLGANGVYRATLPAVGCPATADWALLNNGWPAGTGDGNPTGKVLGRIELAVARTDPNVIYAMGAHATSSNVLGVWRSNNGGVSWTQTAVGTGVQAQSCANAASGGTQMWYDAALTVDPNNAENVLLSGIDLFRSTNGGTTFQNITCGYGNGNVHVDHHATAYLSLAGGGWDSNKVLTGSDGGVYYTENVLNGTGGTAAANRPTYISLNRTINSIEFYSGDITANFATSTLPGAAGGAQDNGSMWARWTSGNPNPVEWTNRLGGDGIYSRIEPILEQRWYHSSQNGGLVATQAGPAGATTNATPTAGWASDPPSFVMPVELYRYGELDVAGSGCTSSAGCGYMLGGTNRVWESLTGAIPRTSWYINSPNLTKQTLGNRSFINQLSHAYKSPKVVIVGTNDGNVQISFTMNQGTANSATWINVTDSNAVLPNRPIMDVTVDVGDAMSPTVSAVGYASLGGFDQNTPSQPGHVYQLQCQNACSTFTWRNVSGNLPNIPANSIAVNPHIPNQVFAGTDWGLYYTNDVSAAEPVWYRFDNGLPRVMVWDMAIDRGATTLAVFTRGRGAWAWPLPTSLDDTIFRNGFDSGTP